MSAHRVLQSWKEIAGYVGRTERTLQRWEQEFGFPVHRPAGKSRSAVMALAQEIQEWTRGKPSLLQIRDVRRFSRRELLAATPGHDQSGSRGTQSSVPQLPTRSSFAFTGPESGRAMFEYQRLSEHSQVSVSLRAKSKTLRHNLKSLLAEQRGLRAQLRKGRESRRTDRQSH